MLKTLVIVPKISGTLIYECADFGGDTVDKKYWNTICGQFGGVRTSGVKLCSVSYGLDDNAKEILNTSSLLFIYPDKATYDFGSFAIGRTKAVGPVLVCTSKYKGFGNTEFAVSYIRYASASSLPIIDPKTEMSLDQMFKEYGNK